MSDNILIIGSGGREHALAWKLSLSKHVNRIYVAPGNDGMNLTDKVETINIKETNFHDLSEFAINQHIDLIIVGPEKPLSLGIVDHLEACGLNVIGPSESAARLESSKYFAKKFMVENGIPTADYSAHQHHQDALKALDEIDIEKDGIVIKADELASGKGVVVTHDRELAKQTIYDFMINPECTVKTDTIILEEKLNGKEVSFFAISDGDHFVSLGHACDYKRLFNDNQGPNTGGMGGYTPTNWPSEDLILNIEQNVFEKTLKGMKKIGTPFKGFLFAGLMIEGDQIKVLEYNVRFGDPEAQILMPTIEEDFYPLLRDATTNRLRGNYYFKHNKLKAVHVVMSSGGYPSTHSTPMHLGETIQFDSSLDHLASCQIFYSGVKKEKDHFVNTGGRVLGVTCTGHSVTEARSAAYQIIDKIKFNHAHFRSDIANG